MLHGRTTHVTVAGMSRGLVLAVSVATAVAAHAQTKAPAQVAPHPGLVRVLADTPESRAEWDRVLARMVKAGALKVREERATSSNGPHDQWLDQLHKGVPVVGGDVWRRLEGGVLTAAEGTIYEKIAINPVPKLTRAEVRLAVTALVPGSAGPSRPPELVVLPTDKGAYVLAYRARVFTGTELIVHYLDASTGAVVLSETAADGPPPVAR
jgi:hypothetical protein